MTFDWTIRNEHVLLIVGWAAGVGVLCWKINQWFTQLGSQVKDGFKQNDLDHKRIGDVVERNTTIIDGHTVLLNEHSAKLGAVAAKCQAHHP